MLTIVFKLSVNLHQALIKVPPDELTYDCIITFFRTLTNKFTLAIKKIQPLA